MGKEKMIYKHQRDTHYNKSKKQKKQEWKGERRNNEKREDKGKNEMETGGLWKEGRTGRERESLCEREEAYQLYSTLCSKHKNSKKKKIKIFKTVFVQGGRS